MTTTSKAARRGSTDLARGVIVNIVGILAASMRSIFMLLIARLLGSEALGTFGLAWAVTEIASKVGTFGLDDAVMALVAKREATGDRAGCRYLFRSSVAWGFGISVVTAALGFFAVRSIGDQLGHASVLVEAIAYMLLALPGIALYRIGNSVSRGLKVMKHDIFSRGVTETPVTIVTLVVANFAGMGVMASVLAVIVGTFAGGVVAVALAAGLVRDAPRGEPFPITRPMLSYAAPIAAYSLLNLIIFRMDALVLGLLIGRAPGVTLAVFGVYCAAMEIASGMPKVRQTFDPIFIPTIAGLVVRGDWVRLRETIARVSRWVLAVQLPLAGIMALGGGVLLAFFGKGFEGAILWTAILGLAHGTNSFVGLAESVIMIDRPRVNLINSAITVLGHAVVSVLLAWRFGAAGAALGMLVAYSFLGVLRYRKIHSFFGWNWPWRALLRPLGVFALSLPPAITARVIFSGHVADLLAILLLVGGNIAGWKIIGLEPSDRAILTELRAGRKSA